MYPSSSLELVWLWSNTCLGSAWHTNWQMVPRKAMAVKPWHACQNASASTAFNALPYTHLSLDMSEDEEAWPASEAEEMDLAFHGS